MSNKVVPVAVLTAAVVGIVALAKKTKVERRRNNTTLEVEDLSSRGEALLTPTLPYLLGFLRALQDHADVCTNPSGCIPLCVAENKLVIDLLSQRLVQSETAVRAFHDASVFCYNNFLGLPSARASLAYFIAKHIMRNLSYNDALQIVDPEFVAFGSGGSSLLSHLALSLCERGDAVLIPAPYYAAFDADLRIVAGCVAVPVHMKDPCVPTSDELEAAARAAESRGMRVRVLLVTNPHNPLGIIYPPRVVRSMIDWARTRGMHTIVDELYALSVHDSRTGFESVLRTLDNDLRNDVHHVWALSKDFGASGFRFASLYTQNRQLLSALANLNIFSGVSHPMQAMMAEVLRDDDFVYRFVETSRQRIRRSYEMCASRLDEMVIPYTRATSGIFVYADFSSLLPEQSPEGEARFTELLLDAAKVILTPGHAQHDLRPGMYRICYTFVSPELLDVALARLDRLVGKIRRCHWDNLNTTTFKGIIE